MRKHILKTGLILLAIIGIMPMVCLAGENATTTEIRISDTVKVEDCRPFGSQCKAGPQYLKKPVVMNFEGMLHRRILIGEIYAEGVMSTRGKPSNQVTRDWYVGADITVLSGQAKGQKRKIKAIETRKGIGHYWRKGDDKPTDRDFYVFDKPVTGIDESLRKGLRRFAGTKGANPHHAMGCLIEKNDLSFGSTSSKHAKLKAGMYGFVHDDLPPSTEGKSAIWLSSEAGAKALPNRVHSTTLTDCNRVYKVSFWAKAGSAGAKIHIAFEGGNDMPSEDIALTSKWKHYERSYDLKGKFPAPKAGEPMNSKLVNLMSYIGVSSGKVLLDDVEISGEGYKNPTPWVDELVEALRLFGGANFRKQVTAGAGLSDYFKLAITQPAFSGKYNPVPEERRGGVGRPGIYDVYSLCEHLNMEPWFNTPGTINVEEIDLMMEYIGASTDTPGGKLRAKHGHPKPWIETLPRIHIEFGNEIWNFGGGYNGPDHWKDLITRAKKSPYYDPEKIIFHVGGWATNLGLNLPIIDHCPNADRLTVAPYICHRYPGNIREACPTPADRARWVIGYGIDQNITSSAMQKQKEAAAANGIELSNYEMNHHLIALGKKTGEFNATKKKEDTKLINEYLPSQIAGVAVANNMLALLREHHMRDQSFFNLTGNFFGLKLWGGVLRASMKPEECRYRPTWLALAATNHGIFGDLVTTSHSGENPTFAAVAIPRSGGKKKKERAPYECLWSYSFKDGKKRSLIVSNLDVMKALTITIRMPGKVGSKAKMWQSIGKDFMASNELEKPEAEAFLNASEITDFKNGYTLTLPAATITTISWIEK